MAEINETAVVETAQEAPQEIAVAQQTALAGVAAGPTALGNPWSDKQAFAQMWRAATLLADTSLVPAAYQKKPQDCFVAVEMAVRMNTSPLYVMQNLYVVKGKPSWAGQACIAMINACGKFRNVRLVYTGEKGTDGRGCYLAALRLSDGQEIHGTEITMAMAKAEGWTSNTKWKNMPEQMLGYRAASFFARLHCPEALMGLQTYEEVIDADQNNGISDLTDALR